jgi:hypothetical protein
VSDLDGIHERGEKEFIACFAMSMKLARRVWPLM